jgi:aminopeptidase
VDSPVLYPILKEHPVTDPRVQKLAQVLIHYSLSVKPGDKVLIQAPANAAPLITEAYREAIRAGAHVFTRIGLNDLREIRLRESNDAQLTYISELDTFENEFYDAILYLLADENTKLLMGIDPQRMGMYRAARKELGARSDERSANGELRWSLTLYPTQAYAQGAGMSLSEYENFVYGAGLLDHDDPVEAWRKIGQEQQHIADYLTAHDEIHIVAPDTDITYRVGGRKWINADGKVNFPDGEVFSAPIEDSVNGVVRYSYPAIYTGREVEDIRLVFKDGRVVEASAAKGEDFLHAMLDLDEGARTLGEAAFGTNYGIQRFTGEMLFDEKIGGTMHMALGAAYKQCGGKNESGLHWDMLCDLHEGRVYADGELCYEKGRFVI